MWWNKFINLFYYTYMTCWYALIMTSEKYRGICTKYIDKYKQS